MTTDPAVDRNREVTADEVEALITLQVVDGLVRTAAEATTTKFLLDPKVQQVLDEEIHSLLAATRGEISAHRATVVDRQDLSDWVSANARRRVAAIIGHLSDPSAIGPLEVRTRQEYAALAERLRQTLAGRALIEQATGVLAGRGGITIQESSTLLRSYAEQRGLPLQATAAAIVDGSLTDVVLQFWRDQQ